MDDRQQRIDNLTLLIREHGLVPDSHKGEQGSWGLPHTVIVALARDSPTFPMDWRDVAELLNVDPSDVPAQVSWERPDL